jgi:hypothetical protein
MKDIIMYERYGRTELAGEWNEPPDYPTTILMQKYSEQSAEAKERQQFIEHICAMFEQLERIGIQSWRVDARTLTELSELSIDEFQIKLRNSSREEKERDELLDEVRMLDDNES